MLLAIVVTLPFFLSRWVYLDAKHRDMSAWLWAILTFVLTVVALVIYLGVRSKQPAAPAQDDPVTGP